MEEEYETVYVLADVVDISRQIIYLLVNGKK